MKQRTESQTQAAPIRRAEAGPAPITARALWRIALGFAFVCVTAHLGFAQSDSQRVQDLERKLEQSQQIIQELVNRITKLEAAQTSPASAPAAKPSAHAHDEPQPAQPVVADPGITLPVIGTPLHGFMDVGGVAGSERHRRKGFTVGSWDLYLTPDLGGNVKGLIETLFEVDSEGKLAVDVERVQIGYAFGDYLTAWVGRFHTPFGYYNTAFHHGTYLMTAARRPAFIDFEDKGGIIAAHTVGLWGTGGFAVGDGRLSYDLFVGNAPTIDDGVLDMNMGGLRRFTPSVGVNIGYGFRGAFEGLTLGVHWFRADVRNVTLDSKANLNVAGGYLTFLDDPWEFISEFYRFDNKDITGKTGLHGSMAAFGQLGWNFGRWTPYVRSEWTGLNQRDPYFRDQENGRSYIRGAPGLRFDLTSKAAVKLEYRYTLTKEPSGERKGGSGLETQFSVRF